MKHISKFIIGTLIVIDVVLFLYVLVHGNNIPLLHPKGMIAMKERNLMITATLLMLLVVIPVFIITFIISWKYRASNTEAKYSPDWSGNNIVKFTWWGILVAVMFVLAVITWKATHTLDPYKPIASTTKPITIQVVALNWKWLFIYPEQNIATVNFVEFPAQTPVTFELTADAPMNSFWIPQLGGQMYAMAGMQNQLHLIADASGDFSGSEVEINGSGFAGMRFTARASSSADFAAWVQSVKQSSNALDFTAYNKLAKPSENNSVAYYSSVEKDLYNRIIMKFIAPSSTKSGQKMLNMQDMQR